jgi:putative oxidoreductase
MDSATGVSGAALLLRIAAGVVFLAHGVPKLVPEREGMKVGRRRLVESITQLGFPWPEGWAWAVGVLQAAGGVLLLLGLFTPWVAGALAVVMAVAMYKQSPEGFVLAADFPFVLVFVLLALVLLGSGRFSVGALLGG